MRDSLDNSYIANQGEIEKQALKLYGESEQKAVDYLTNYSNTQAQQMLARWKELAIYLIVKYNDMAVKPTKDGKFLRTKTGNGATVKRPGFPEKVARALVEQTGDRFASPE